MKKQKKINLWWIVGLLLPPVGLVLFLLWRKNRKEDAKTIGTCSLISAIFWLFLGLSFIPNNSDNSGAIPTINNMLKDVDISLAGKEVSSWYKDVSSGDAVVTVIASSTCPHCKNLKPVITASSKKHNYKLYFFEADTLSDDDYLIISNSIDLEGYEGYVPYTFVIKDRDFKGSHTGEMEDEDLVDFLIETEVLEG